MSFSTLMGAIAAPRDTADPYAYADDAAPQFHGSSRSGWFQQTCRHLLDALPGHETLRFLSAQMATRKQLETGGRTTWTLVPAEALVELDDLLHACARSPHLLVERVFQEHANGDVAAALERAVECRQLNEQGEDGTSLPFFFAALVSLRALLRLAQERSLVVVYFNWLPS